jgi:hypothetical protein
MFADPMVAPLKKMVNTCKSYVVALNALVLQAKRDVTGSDSQVASIDQLVRYSSRASIGYSPGVEDVAINLDQEVFRISMVDV